MADRIFLISTIKNSRVGKLYYAHGFKELNGITKALQKRGHNTEVMEITNTFYHNQVFDINEIKTQTKKKEPCPERRVKCLETGQVAINGKQLAEHMGINPAIVYVSITEERQYNGYTFIFTSEPLTIVPKEIVNNRWPGGFKVTCLETGKTYECVKDAARDIGISMQYIYNSIRSGKPFSGLTFVKTY